MTGKSEPARRSNLAGSALPATDEETGSACYTLPVSSSVPVVPIPVRVPFAYFCMAV